MKRVYGHKQPRVPHRNLSLHRMSLASAVKLPSIVDLKPLCPPIIDQGQVGSCTGCSGVAAVSMLSQRAINDGVWRGDRLIASALALYYEERQIDGTTEDDAGASLADAVRVLSTIGCVPDSDWPYDESRMFDPPPTSAIVDAQQAKLADYSPIDCNVDVVRECIALGFPVHVGVQVFSSFESDAVAATGHVPLPGGGEQCLGGHAILLVGYDDATGTVTFRNSWGTSWGNSGYGTLPYAYIGSGDLTTELYVYRRIAQAAP